MKKKVILGTIAAIAVSSAVIHGISKADSQQTSGMSDVTLANIEALANDNDEIESIPCRQNQNDLDRICNIYDPGIYCPCGW